MTTPDDQTTLPSDGRRKYDTIDDQAEGERGEQPVERAGQARIPSASILVSISAADLEEKRKRSHHPF
jgi:hypothetical protein